MAGPDRTIFRERAIEKYIQRQDLHAILRLVSPPVCRCLWAIILLGCVGGVLVWSIQVPVQVGGIGLMIEEAGKEGSAGQPSVVVLLLLPPEQGSQIHVGQEVRYCVEGATRCLTGSLEVVGEAEQSPEEIRVRYKLPVVQGQEIVGPAVVGVAKVGTPVQRGLYVGGRGQVEVQTGTESALMFWWAMGEGFGG